MEQALGEAVAWSGWVRALPLELQGFPSLFFHTMRARPVVGHLSPLLSFLGTLLVAMSGSHARDLLLVPNDPPVILSSCLSFFPSFLLPFSLSLLLPCCRRLGSRPGRASR